MHIAIIGSGPSAFYTCQGLINNQDNVRIDFLEKLPAPYGLVRYGVAPDHQKTKNIIRLFSKLLENDNVNFFGNIDVGIDVSIEFISNNYDAVVIASGAENDRRLFLEGEDKIGIYGSGEFVGWYNGIPKYENLSPNLNVSNAVIIGNGNVALDLARILAKIKSEFFNSDITEYSLNNLVHSSIENIYVVGRRSPLEARFTIAELREIGNLEDFSPIIDYSLEKLKKIAITKDLETKIKKNIELMIDYKENSNFKKKKIIFKFLRSPEKLLGGKEVKSILLRKNLIENNNLTHTDEFEEIETGLVISAIGYNTKQIENVLLEKNSSFYSNKDGYINKNIYVTGWAASSSVGVIGSNKVMANMLSKKICKEISSKKENSTISLLNFLNQNHKRFTTKKDWKKIDQNEIINAKTNFTRKKHVNIEKIFKFLES